MAAEVRNVWSNVATLPTCDITANAAITDNSGGTDPADNTIAVITNPTLGWNGSTDPTANEATAINAAITATKAAIAQLAAKMNVIRTALLALETDMNELKDSFMLKG